MAIPDKLASILLANIVLFYLQPLINEVRLSTLQIGGQGLVFTFILMMFIPILWVIFTVTGVMAIRSEIVRPVE